MNLKTVLTVDTVNLHLKGSTKNEIINELLDILIAAKKITDREAAFNAVMDREQKMSTGMKHGIAIPRRGYGEIGYLGACQLVIHRNPLYFRSADQIGGRRILPASA